jgi:hypothetical protein
MWYDSKTDLILTVEAYFSLVLIKYIILIQTLYLYNNTEFINSYPKSLYLIFIIPWENVYFPRKLGIG